MILIPETCWEDSLKLFLTILLITSSHLFAATNTEAEKQENWPKVEAYVSKNKPDNYVLSSEGEFVLSFNKDISRFISRKLNKSSMRKLKKKLHKSLSIPLTKRGFVQAAHRETKGKEDTTNYDAIWVRDSAWVYFSMIHGYKNKEKRRKSS